MSAFDALTAIPDEITAGEGETWSETQPDYSSGSYSIVYNFAGNTPVDGFQKFTVTGSGSGTSWTFTMPSGGSSPKPGRYAWQQIVTRTSDSAKREIDCGFLTVRPNLADTPTTTTAATMLAALETAISSLSSSTNQSVSFNGQSYTKKDMKSLLEERARLQAEVLREKNALNALSGTNRDRNITVIFE